MIDSGMTREQAKPLPLAEKGIKLVFLLRMDPHASSDPFEASARWQPVCIAESDDGRRSHVIDLNQALFQGNPVIPIF